VNQQQGTLSPVDEWFEVWCKPVVQALYAHDHAEVDGALARAKAELDRSTLSADQRQALRLKIRYLEYQKVKALGAQADAPIAFRAAVSDIDQPVTGAASRLMRAKLLLQLRASGERAGFMSCPREVFDILLGEIPEGERDLELWHYIANWAFTHRVGEYLARALEEFVFQTPGALSDYFFQRVNTMYLLTERRAMRADITELIRRMRLSEHYEDLVRHIWPVCRAQGLVDSEMEELLEARYSLIQQAGPPQQLFVENSS
jgi:hypothetical protein